MIDSHQHFWKFSPVRDSWITEDMAVIRRDFLPSDLAPILIQHGFEGCVAVQADQSKEETEFLVALAESHEFIKGVVGWVDLMATDLQKQLEAYAQHDKLKGFRHILQGEAPGFMTNPSFIRGVNTLKNFGFTYDLLIYHHQFPEALEFLYHTKGTPIVIDHLAKPSIRTREKTHWELNLAAAATFEYTYCKLSGMVTEANWKNWRYEDFEPYLDEVFEAFGPDRVMYGSDWPVCLVAGSYSDQLSIVQQYIAKLSDTERSKVLGENAKKFYDLVD